MGLSKKFFVLFPWNPYLKTDCTSLLILLLRIKTPFCKNITDNSVFFFMEVECIGNTQITHMEETEKCCRVIRLWFAMGSKVFFFSDMSKIIWQIGQIGWISLFWVCVCTGSYGFWIMPGGGVYQSLYKGATSRNPTWTIPISRHFKGISI